MNCAAKNGMEEFRPELKRVAGGINCAGKNGMEEFRPKLDRRYHKKLASSR